MGEEPAALVLSVFPWQQGNTTPCAVHWVLGRGGGLWHPLPAQALLLSWNLQSPWLGWEDVGFKRLLLEDFFLGAKRKEISGWGQRCPQAGEVRFVMICDLCKPP